MKIKEIPIKITNYNIKDKIDKKNIYIFGMLTINDKKHRIDRDKIYALVNDKKYPLKFKFKRVLIRGIAKLSNSFEIVIPIKDLIGGEINNRVHICYEENNTIVYMKDLRYCNIFKGLRRYEVKKIKIFKEDNTAIILKRTRRNWLVITVRDILKTDSYKEQVKLNLAWLLAKVYPKNIVLMYEKKSERYEEGASIVYEKLMDEKYKNIYYIIDKNSSHVKRIPEKYKKNIVYKYTFKHYLYFFASKAFIGTESMINSLEARTINTHVIRRTVKNNFKYVFLQHGVMYMVSLDSKRRGFFRKKGGMPPFTRIVVSSEEEANHFIELGHFEKEDLYLTGLPKFDRSYRNDDADKILIMPTWRPWEYNTIRKDYKESRIL